MNDEQQTADTPKAGKRRKAHSPNRSVAEQARDLMRDKFRARDYLALMELLRREDPVVLMALQDAMDKLEEPAVQS